MAFLRSARGRGAHPEVAARQKGSEGAGEAARAEARGEGGISPEMHGRCKPSLVGFHLLLDYISFYMV